MLKKGFTLQELLISLAIVGIVAAVVAPAVVALKPNETKVKYIKAYNTLTSLTGQIIEDPAYYYTEYSADGTPTCSGLNCSGIPQTELFQDEFASIWLADYDSVKYGLCLASKMNIKEEFGPDLLQDDALKFTTLDGTSWKFGFHSAQNGTDLTINVDPDDEGNDCTYSNNCTNPKQFKFSIDNDGGITAEDPLGKAFLQNPTDMHSIKEDKAVADKL